MTTIRITDLQDRQARSESFHGGSLRVLSRSGLHPAEALLLNQLPRLPAAPADLLIAGNRTGATALAAAALHPACRIVCHAFDLHHVRALLRNLTANGLAPAFLHDPFAIPPEDLAARGADGALRVACTSAVPAGPYGAALFMATPGTMSGELILDQLEDIHANLAEGAPCVIACEAESAPLLKHIKALFGNLSVHVDRKGLFCATSVRRGAAEKRRKFEAAFEASLPGCEPLTLRSLPGVFCHRRPDAGGLALAEVAARHMKPGSRMLDLGCGCGLVGLLLARHSPGARVCFVDAHARALAATHLNLEALGLSGHDLRLSDTGTAETGFDLFAGNPPYYSDFRIAQLFIDTAYRALRPEGLCLLVAKAADKLQRLQAARFGNAETFPRRGYGVVLSTR